MMRGRELDCATFFAAKFWGAGFWDRLGNFGGCGQAGGQGDELADFAGDTDEGQVRVAGCAGGAGGMAAVCSSASRMALGGGGAGHLHALSNQFIAEFDLAGRGVGSL